MCFFRKWSNFYVLLERFNTLSININQPDRVRCNVVEHSENYKRKIMNMTFWFVFISWKLHVHLCVNIFQQPAKIFLIFISGTFCVNETFSRQLSSWLKSNWSYSTAFYPGESKFSKIFEYRVKEATKLSPENGGKFQITSYPEGIGTRSTLMVFFHIKSVKFYKLITYIK